MSNNLDEIKGLFEKFWQSLANYLNPTERKVKEAESWDGSASRWPDAESYCRSALIDLNGAAGKSDKTKDLCFLPVSDPGESTYNSQAILAAAGGRGISAVKKPDGVSQDDFDKAIKSAAKKIVSAYKEMDREAPESVMEKARALSIDQVFDRVYSASEQRYPMAYLHNLYADDDGSLFALLSQEGRLYRTPIAVKDNGVDMGEWVEVKMEFPQVSQRTQIVRQLNGQVRWFSVSATSVLNRVGEIDSQSLFDSFVAHSSATGLYPYRTFYHKGEQFRTGQADFLARDGNCYITSGLYDNSEIARLEQQAIERDGDYWGESIGYLPTSTPQLIEIGGIKIPVYRSGINVEISTLPEKEAANLFTVIRQEVSRMMTANERQAFLKLFDGDESKMDEWLTQNVDATNRAISEGGLITRSQQQEGETEGEPEQPIEGEPTEGQQVEVDDAVLSEVVRQVTESESFTGFGTQLNDIAEAIEALNGVADKLRTQLDGLQQDVNQRLATLERSKTVERQEWANDLPAKGVVRVGLKQPRFAPDAPTVQSSTDKANSTLSKLPA